MLIVNIFVFNLQVVFPVFVFVVVVVYGKSSWLAFIIE